MVVYISELMYLVNMNTVIQIVSYIGMMMLLIVILPETILVVEFR